MIPGSAYLRQVAIISIQVWIPALDGYPAVRPRRAHSALTRPVRAGQWRPLIPDQPVVRLFAVVNVGEVRHDRTHVRTSFLWESLAAAGDGIP